MWDKLWTEFSNHPTAFGCSVVLVMPVLIGAYFRSSANESYREAAALLPSGGDRKVARSWLLEVLPWLSFLFGGKYFGSGIGFFFTPAWMATLSDPVALQHVADFKRNRRRFWICMAIMVVAIAALRFLPEQFTAAIFSSKQVK